LTTVTQYKWQEYKIRFSLNPCMYSGVVYTICLGINKSAFRPELH